MYLGLTEDEYGRDTTSGRTGKVMPRGPASRPGHRGGQAPSGLTVAPTVPRRIDAAYDVVRMSPSAYADVRAIGESFRAGDVVSMDLTGLTAPKTPSA